MMKRTSSSESFSPKIIFEFLFFLFCKLFFKLFCRLEVHGRENFPKSPFIICSNHCSHADTPVLMLATKFYFKKLGIIVAEDYFFSHKKRRGVVRLFMNTIPLNRQSTHRSFRSTLQQCNKFLNQGGNCLIIYPEGTRSNNGEMQPFKRGIAVLASELNLPIVPVHIHGTHRVLSKNNLIPKPGCITVNIGKALFVKKPREYKESCVIHTLENEIRALRELRQL